RVLFRSTGVRLRDVLEKAGVKPSAVYTGHYGNDVDISGDTEKEVLSRGVPIEKAMEPEALIAWAMNGEDIPALHGFPLRLVIPGYPGSVSQKYLTRIWIRDREHDGANGRLLLPHAEISGGSGNGSSRRRYGNPHGHAREVDHHGAGHWRRSVCRAGGGSARPCMGGQWRCQG